MAKDATVAIGDCVAEIEVVQRIATSMTLQEFSADPIVRRAAAYAIQTISEAIRRIPDEWLADYPNQPWSQIRAIGNRIRHEYFRLDDAILWAIITTDAPALRAVLEAMLVRHTGEGGR